MQRVWRSLPQGVKLAASSLMPASPVVLNPTVGACCGASEDASVVAERMQREMLRLRGRYMAEDGSGVDYAAIAQSEEYKEYCQIAASLQSVDMSSLKGDEAKAFWINVYNALTIHALITASRDKPCKSVLDVPQFWKVSAYRIGAHVLSLDDIEHGIIRCNSPHPSGGGVLFGGGDGRRNLVLQGGVDARIHFALVCGAKSCPPINVFTPANVNDALSAATRNFIRQEVTVDDTGKITMSKIFSWYMNDFAPTEIGVVEWCREQLPECPLKAALARVLAQQHVHPVKIAYSEYNWAINNACSSRQH